MPSFFIWNSVMYSSGKRFAIGATNFCLGTGYFVAFVAADLCFLDFATGWGYIFQGVN